MKRGKRTYAFHYLVNTERFKIAWHSLNKWKGFNGTLSTYIYSFRNYEGYANTVDRYCARWQLCILGLNIGYIYKFID